MSVRVYLAILAFAGISVTQSNAVASDCCECGCHTEKPAKCCRPLINISKTVYRRPMMGFSAAPQQFTVATSAPAVMVPTTAFAVQPTAFVIQQQAAPTTAAATPNTAAGTSNLECKDPCTEIKQLRKDVNDLMDVTGRLTDAVNVLAAEYKANKDKQNQNK